MKIKGMTVKKERNKEHWTVPYAFAGRRSEIHIWRRAEGNFMVYCGAVVDYKDTFEEAVEKAREFTHGGAL